MVKPSHLAIAGGMAFGLWLIFKDSFAVVQCKPPAAGCPPGTTFDSITCSCKPAVPCLGGRMDVCGNCTNILPLIAQSICDIYVPCVPGVQAHYITKVCPAGTVLNTQTCNCDGTTIKDPPYNVGDLVNRNSIYFHELYGNYNNTGYSIYVDQVDVVYLIANATNRVVIIAPGSNIVSLYSYANSHPI
jgi:hypothetical protein